MPTEETTGDKAPKNPLVQIEITEAHTVIGDFEHGRGHVQSIEKSKADALVSLGKAKIIGI